MLDKRGKLQKASLFYDTGCLHSIATGLKGVGKITGEIANFKIGGFSERIQTELPNANIVEFNFENGQKNVLYRSSGYFANQFDGIGKTGKMEEQISEK